MSHSRINVTPQTATGFFFLANGLCHGTLMARMPALKAHVGVNDQLLGQALLALGLGALAAFPLTGRMVKRYGSALVTCVMCAALLLVVSLPAIADRWSLLAGSMLLIGVFSGSLNVAMNAQAIAVERHTCRPVMSTMHGMYSLGGVLGALGTAILSNIAVTHHLLGISAVGLALLPLCGVKLMDDAPPTLLVQKKKRLSLPHKSLQGLCVLAMCAFLCEGAIADWSALLLHDGKGASEAVSALGFGSFAACMLIGRLSGDRLRTRFDESMLIRYLSLAACSGLLLSVFAVNPWLCIVGFGLAGSGFSIMVPIIISSAGRREHVDPSAAVVAVSTFGYGGLLMGPPLIGFLAHAITLQFAMLTLVVLTIVICAGGRLVRTTVPNRILTEQPIT
jgi:MFS family permease